MAASGKKTTTMKRFREAKLRERRLEKQAKKAARKLAAASEDDRQADTVVDEPSEAAEL